MNTIHHTHCQRIVLWLLITAGTTACFRPAPDASKPTRIHRAPAIPAAAAIDPAHQPIRYAVVISVDGLAARYLQTAIDSDQLPTFKALQTKGAWTHEARTDFFNTTTLPNHTSMLTGLPVGRPRGFPEDAHHGFTINVLPPPRATLHNLGNRKISYVPSIFDVAHDMGLKTCLLAGKPKFVIFERSYDRDHGKKDAIGKDNGRQKIDRSFITEDTRKLITTFIEQQKESPCHLTFLHLADMDAEGHTSGWGSPAWMTRLQTVDSFLGEILQLIATNPAMAGKTALILSADHGGTGTDHGQADRRTNFTIPFYVVAPSVPAGKDLYSLVPETRFNPGVRNPPYSAPRQPIRNGDMGNLALELMGLPSIPGSVMFGMNLMQASATN